MSAEYATFGLAPAMRAGGVLASGACQTHRDFMDFIVDGKPLLFQLCDLDAVSPLASDVPPAILLAEVRTLLLDTPTRLAGGRCVIYACPECQSLECGAVTAVIERDGADIVWRDFAWQTADHADLELNGYHGLGPFRFRADAYRATLERLLTNLTDLADITDAVAAGWAPPRSRRALLIGARVAVLARLAAALRSVGIGADISRDARRVSATELRAYGAVAFGRAVDEPARAAVRAAFDAVGAEVAYVDGLAPIIPVLVAQIEHALDRNPPERRRLTTLTAHDGRALVEVASTCQVRLLAYRLDRLYRTRERSVFAGTLEPGEHRIPLDDRVVGGRSFLVARTLENVLVTPVTQEL